jgi:hypothetical protein
MAAVPTAAAGFAHADSFYSYSYGDSPLSINLDNPFSSGSDNARGGVETFSMNLGGEILEMDMVFKRGSNSSNSDSFKEAAGFTNTTKSGLNATFNNYKSKGAGNRYASGDVVKETNSSQSVTLAYKRLDTAPSSSKGKKGGEPETQILKGKFGNAEGEDLGFLGFSVVEDGDVLGTGWLSIGLNLDDGIFNLYGWGVGMGDKTVLAGQTAGESVVPGPAGIFALAAGAAGIRRKRKRTA